MHAILGLCFPDRDEELRDYLESINEDYYDLEMDERIGKKVAYRPRQYTNDEIINALKK